MAAAVANGFSNGHHHANGHVMNGNNGFLNNLNGMLKNFAPVMDVSEVSQRLYAIRRKRSNSVDSSS